MKNKTQFSCGVLATIHGIFFYFYLEMCYIVMLSPVPGQIIKNIGKMPTNVIQQSTHKQTYVVCEFS